MAHQLDKKISATELARNLATVIDQVRVARMPIIITRGNKDIAQISPVVNTEITVSDLAMLIRNNTLSRSQRKTFADDLGTVRQAATLPASDWD